MWAVGGLLVAGITAQKLAMGRPKFKKHEGPYAVPVSAEEGAPYRNSDYPEIVAEPYPGCTTIFNTFQYAVKHHSFRNALGTRELIKASRPAMRRATPPAPPRLRCGPCGGPAPGRSDSPVPPLH